jgi:hypothetical protein
MATTAEPHMRLVRPAEGGHGGARRLDAPSRLESLHKQMAHLIRLPRRQLEEELAKNGVPQNLLKDLGKLQAKLGTLGLRQWPVEEVAPPAKQLVVMRGADIDDTWAELLESGALLESSDFVQAMGWSRQALSKALQANRVFFLDSRGSRYYPAFYADRRRYERRHLEAVTKLLGDLPGGAKWVFFTTPKGSLRRLTPLQALAKGQLAAVMAAAEGYADR